jgi:hypothetical protein
MTKEVGNVADKKQLTLEQKRKVLAENLWLNYFNEYLYQRKIITEAQRNCMSSQIESHKAITVYSKETTA